MKIPKIKDIQSLTGRVASLTKFISKVTDRCTPFFKVLKDSKRSITWTAECDKAFSELKEYMSWAPLLSTPKPGDILMIYLSVSAMAVSFVLILPRESVEHPVHYVSKALQDAEVRYPDIEKLAFALVVSARRLRPYFQAHTIYVLTDQPLRQVLQKPETSGRLVKWAIELGEFDIHYKPYPAIKGQAVADFISEFKEPQALAAIQIITEPNLPLGQLHVASNEKLDLTQPLWTLYMDGSSNAQGCRASLVLISPDKDFTAKDISLIAYLQHTHHLLATFDAHLISQVPRSENSHADALARLAWALEQGIGRNIHIEFLDQRSTQAPLIYTIDHSPTWMDPIIQFLQNQTLPAGLAEARRVGYRSAPYLIINDCLYKPGFSLPYLRCLTPEEGNYVLWEIYEGICDNHSSARSLAHKPIRQGYFWPSLHTDAQAFTQKCDKFVAVDYFTKWAEVEALATITAARIETFVWQNIVCRFGIPHTIVTDNGRQFDNAKFKQFCSNLKIRLCFTSPAHPQSNGQVEAVNKIIKKTLKTKLDQAKAVAPVEIGKPTYRTSTYDAKANDEQLALNLDYIDELRDQSNMCNVAIGDWIMRKVSLATKNPTEGTLGPTWEGPYEITKVYRSSTYQLRDPKGKTLPHPWNADHLKYYYK
ncbi:PREDICTED: uncharacterized protein LOC103328449 [Prunus mume]|uniref:Uncharacterized protein LOC103328449 n=1 Tax=Prunus mume TaxID=102107 RepID=A0ABM0NS89_PRUMU|nr:PREDICTED: uncharacterized protein LOC103328449 [Prunus mume]